MRDQSCTLSTRACTWAGLPNAGDHVQACLQGAGSLLAHHLVGLPAVGSALGVAGQRPVDAHVLQDLSGYLARVRPRPLDPHVLRGHLVGRAQRALHLLQVHSGGRHHHVHLLGVKLLGARCQFL
eukprot:1138662-Pelagomonas_calceolata.AAC.6